MESLSDYYRRVRNLTTYAFPDGIPQGQQATLVNAIISGVDDPSVAKHAWSQTQANFLKIIPKILQFNGIYTVSSLSAD